MIATRHGAVAGLLTLACAVLVCRAEDPPAPARKITEPPAAWRLAPFYTKHVDLGGLPIVASGKVSDYALFEAAYIVDRMLANRPDVLAELAKNRVRLAVMAWDERTTQIPEHSDLEPGKYWDRRARGLGATRARPAVSCAEENLLGYKGDPYAAENILVHEFAHAVHEMGLASLDRAFHDRLRAIYDEAIADGLWKGTYAATNPAEYWAEGVQSWFGTNRQNDAQHNHVDTRDELEAYDPRLAALILESLGRSDWLYVRPDRRDAAGRAHLKGYDPAAAPTFAWEPELQAWYDDDMARQAEERRRARDKDTPPKPRP